MDVLNKLAAAKGLSRGSVRAQRIMDCQHRVGNVHGCAHGNERAKYAASAKKVLQECLLAGHTPLCNPRHTACTDTCRLFISHKHKACVCLDSSNVHMCGEACTLPARVSMDNDTYVCPLTHMVLPDKIVSHAPSFDKSGNIVLHWGFQSKKKGQNARKRPKKKIAKERTAEGIIKIISACFAAGHAARKHRLAKKAASVAIKVKRMKDASFADVAAVVHAHKVSLPPILADINRALAGIIAHYFAKNPAVAAMGSLDMAVCTLLTLMASGYKTQNTTVVDKIDCVACRMPLPNEMSTVPKINCRNMSTGVRTFKAYVLNKSGIPVYNKCLRLKPCQARELLVAANP